MVDIKALKAKYASQRKADDSIFAVVLGPRGMGKSTAAAGSWGKDTVVLQLVFLQEDHAVQSALCTAKNKDNIIPVFLDIDDNGDKRSYDQTFDALMGYLEADLAGIDVVVLDGLSALDTVIANHPKVLAADKFSTTKVAALLYDAVLMALKKLTLQKKDVVITCPLEILVGDDGMYMAPQLRGKAAVSTIIGAAPEILVMGNVESEKGLAYVFDFAPLVINKTGTKMNKESYSLPVKPRVAGREPPTHMIASFAYLKKFKGEGAEKK